MKRQTYRRIMLVINHPMGGRVVFLKVNDEQYTFLEELSNMTKPLPGTVGPITQPYLEVINDRSGKYPSREMP